MIKKQTIDKTFVNSVFIFILLKICIYLTIILIYGAANTLTGIPAVFKVAPNA